MLEIGATDYHTAGEPFRIVAGNTVDIPGATILERREYATASEEIDGIRRLLCHEPRGHADMYGCFVVPPDDDGADFGVLFWHKDGYSPWVNLLPCPSVHADLASLAAFVAADEDAAARAVEVALGERECLALMRSPARHSTTISARVLRPCTESPASRITATISSTVGGSAGYRRPLLRGGRPRWNPGLVAGDQR